MAKTVEPLAEKRSGRCGVYEQPRWVIRWPIILDKTMQKDAVDTRSQEAFFPFGRSCSAGQISSSGGRHGWSNTCIRLSRHLGGQHSAKLVTLRAQPPATTFEVDTNTYATTVEVDLMGVLIKVKQQLAFSDNEHTAGNLHWRMSELFQI